MLFYFVNRGQPLSPFCDILENIKLQGCTISRKIKSYCNLDIKTELVPAEYQVLNQTCLNLKWFAACVFYYEFVQPNAQLSLWPMHFWFQYLQSGVNFNSSTTSLSYIGGMIETADFCPYQGVRWMHTKWCTHLCTPLFMLLLLKQHEFSLANKFLESMVPPMTMNVLNYTCIHDFLNIFNMLTKYFIYTPCRVLLSVVILTMPKEQVWMWKIDVNMNEWWMTW